MKKILMLLMVAGIFSLVACGPSEEEKAAAEAEAAAAVEELFNGLEEEVATEETATELAAHVCDDKCKEACTGPRCGEAGHECTEACHAAKGDGEAHEHTEGDGHEH